MKMDPSTLALLEPNTPTRPAPTNDLNAIQFLDITVDRSLGEVSHGSPKLGNYLAANLSL